MWRYILSQLAAFLNKINPNKHTESCVCLLFKLHYKNDTYRSISHAVIVDLNKDFVSILYRFIMESAYGA